MNIPLYKHYHYEIPRVATTDADYSIPIICKKLSYHGKYLDTIQVLPPQVEEIDFERSNITTLPAIPDGVTTIDLHHTLLSSPLEFGEGSRIKTINLILDNGAKKIYQQLPECLEWIYFNDKVEISHIPTNATRVYYNGENDSFKASLRLHGFKRTAWNHDTWYRVL